MKTVVQILFFIFFHNLSGHSQEKLPTDGYGNGIDKNNKKEIRDPIYKTLGFGITERFRILKNQEYKRPEIEKKRNEFFHQSVKLSKRVSEIGLPHIGDFHFKDYAYVDPKSSVLRYNYFLVAADLYPSFYLFDTNKDQGNIRITFGVKVRVWNKRRKPLRSSYTWDPSHPIKTPSYLPGIYYSRILKYAEGNNVSSVDYIEIGFGHHSNGQDAPTLASQDSTLILPEDIIYNLEDGDFSSNSLLLKYYKVQSAIDSYHKIQSIYFKLDGIGTKRIEHENLNKYNIGYTYRFIKLQKERLFDNSFLEKHKIQFSFNFGLVSFNNLELKKSISYSIAYHHRIPFSSNVSVFCKYGYLGQDDYNIYLEQSLHYLRLGISMAPWL